MTVDARSFRNACGRFGTGVIIATCADPNGAPVGVTVNSFSSVSLDPPLVLFCIDHRAFSRTAFRDAQTFALNVLADDQQSLADRFARASADKFSGLDYTTGHGGAPVLPGALATFECDVEAQYPGGDHDILVGRVAAIDFGPDTAKPLLYFGGAYRALAER